MSGTRRPPGFQIYQDEDPSPACQHPQKPRPQLQPSAIPRQPSLDPNHQHNIALNAPNVPAYSQGHPMSPQKLHHFGPPLMPYNHLGYVDLPAPQGPQPYQESPTKRMFPGPHTHCAPPQANSGMLVFDANFESFEQENYPVAAANDNADFPSPSYRRRNALKRSQSDVVPTYDRGIKRQRVEEDTKMQIPDPADMPVIEDTGEKPAYSYAQMIGMAILRAPLRKLTLSQIYEWISTTFKYYREDPKAGWHNSIRHNLSLNKAFNKVERPKGDAGKGSYWVIEEGMEGPFLKEKGRKVNNLPNLDLNMNTNVIRPELPPFSQPTMMPEPLAPSPFIQETFPCLPRPQTAPAIPDPSSDATVPASDPALHEDHEDPALESAGLLPQSSPPVGIQSSPPVVANFHRRSGSSPSVRRHPPSILGHKRNAATMDDSGYFSSLPSSAMRPRQSQTILTSEIDSEPARKKLKPGSAQAAIVRLRGSSQDPTPSQRRTMNAAAMLMDPAASSPPRSSPILQPATPIVFKKPARPIPESVSPNTQLLLHRQDMQAFMASPTPDLLPNHPTDLFSDTNSPNKSSATPGPPGGGDQFLIFDENHEFTPVITPAYGRSPVKSAKRTPLGPAHNCSSKLNEFLQSAHQGRLNAARDDKTPTKANPWIKPASSYAFSGSPLKDVTSIAAFGDENEFSNFVEYVEDDIGDDDFDLLAGFDPIGPVVNPRHVSKRPPLGGRSFTSRF